MSTKKTVYFMEVYQLDSNDNAHTLTPGFWTKLFNHLSSALPEERQSTYKSNVLYGECRSDKMTLLDYTYLGKSRPQSDWPDVQDHGGQIDSLTTVGGISGLLEPVYIAPVDASNTAAFLRTSGGPTWQAIEAWLNTVTGVAAGQPEFRLRPLVKTDGLERLRDSLGVSKMHVKLDADSLSSAGHHGVIGAAAQAAESVSGDLSMELILSFGHATPDSMAAEDLKDQLEIFMRQHMFKKSRATLMVDKGADGIGRESIDFTSDRITSVEKVDVAEDDQPSLQSALIALSSAIQKYKAGKL
ncbi:hypothetical protein [Arthrobacter sp. ISL-69]|uniref:hypothetical protein n=1 Tax=Arthrobacter sp. ISL-69 TaxID=2819113 RepID=UPI001BEAB47D|nr:hypothetical protein [Arthrobacter sp. ISL-69]MBT2536288.1 hypothetical protein [Arthrobacter sp. ISL-69]